MNEATDPQAGYKEWFNSPFHHKLYAERDKEEAKTFIHNLLQILQPPPGSRILEIGCDRGHHSKMLASAGFDTTGIDISPDSIALAKQSESESLHFFIHDIRLPFWINYFDYAFSLFNSFGYFKTRREHDDAIRTIGSGLRPGGVFVIDYPNVHYTEENIVYNETRQIDSTRYDIRRWHDDTHFYKKIEVSDPGLSHPVTFTEKTAKFSLGDFTDMLSFQALQVQEIFGDYHLNEYHVNKTPRLIIIARKKSNEPTDKQKRLYSDGRTSDPLT